MKLFKNQTQQDSRPIIVVNHWLTHLQQIFRPVIEFQYWVGWRSRMDMVNTEPAPLLIPIGKTYGFNNGNDGGL